MEVFHCHSEGMMCGSGFWSRSIIRYSFIFITCIDHVHIYITCLTGMIRCSTVSPDGQWVAVGYSSGIVSVLDVRTGILMASWKAHEGEVLQVRSCAVTIY